MLTTPKDSHETTSMRFLQVYLEFIILCVKVHIFGMVFRFKNRPPTAPQRRR